MTFELLEPEWELVRNVPLSDLIELAADLGVILPEEVDRRQLVVISLPYLLERARDDGLPLSKYDAPDIEALPPEDLAMVAELQGLKPSASVRAVMRAGAKVTKTYARNRPNNPYPYMLPLLLGTLLRFARSERS